MNAPHEPVTRPASASGLVRRIAATVIMSGVVFLLLWLMAFSVFTSLLIAGGCCVVVVAASAASDPVEMVLDSIAAVVFGVIGSDRCFLRRNIQSLRQLKGSRPRTGASLDYVITLLRHDVRRRSEHAVQGRERGAREGECAWIG